MQTPLEESFYKVHGNEHKQQLHSNLLLFYFLHGRGTIASPFWLGMAVGGVGMGCSMFSNMLDLSRGYHGDFSASLSALSLQKHVDSHPCV